MLTYAQPIRILLAAKHIPNSATVSKRTGEQTFTLRHKLTLYQDEKGQQPVVIDGYFLVSDRAQITQISGDKPMMWHTTPAELSRTIDENFNFSEDAEG